MSKVQDPLEQEHELVDLIYRLDAEVTEKGNLLKKAKLSLVLLKAPPALADKVRAGIALTLADRVQLKDLCAREYQAADGRTASVVVATDEISSYDLYPDAAYKAWLTAKGVKKGSLKLEREWRGLREDEARGLCGEHFRTLFDFLPVYLPTTAFETFAPRLLTEAKSRDILAFCISKKAPQAPYVKIPKPKDEE